METKINNNVKNIFKSNKYDLSYNFTKKIIELINFKENFLL